MIVPHQTGVVMTPLSASRILLFLGLWMIAGAGAAAQESLSAGLIGLLLALLCFGARFLIKFISERSMVTAQNDPPATYSPPWES